MKQKYLLSILMSASFLLITSLGSLYAQERTVSGKVVDGEDNSAMPGVNVIVKGTSEGTVTDFDGNYSLNVPENTTLVFSFVGYQKEEILVGTRSVIDVTLMPDIQALQEIVVIGYGVSKKKDLTGTIESVSAKDFNQGAITSPQQLINGKVAGVQIVDGGGAPGAGNTIRIRAGSSISASNDPLIIIDGVPVDNEGIDGARNPLNVINPNDIESFTVLKDASATAIYGSRASNGVIIITTKKGATGALKVDYNGNVSVSTPTQLVDVLGADEYREVLGQKFPENTGLLGEANTDWQDNIYRNAISTDHNVSVSGTVANVLPTRASVGYNLANGILDESQMQRTSAALNLNPDLFDDHLSIDISAKFANIQNNFSATDAIGDAIAMDPTQPITSSDDRYDPFGGYFTWIGAEGNPNVNAPRNGRARIDQRRDRSVVNRFVGNAQFDYKFHFLPELKANLNLGMDYSKSTDDGGVFNPADAGWDSEAFLRGGSTRTYTQLKRNRLLEFYMQYNKNLEDLNSRFDVMAGYSWQHFWRESESEELFGTPNSEGSFARSPYNLTRQENYLVSFFGRFNYVYNEKYYLTFTLRNDGSSRFSEDTRWGLFPSAALAWSISEESFLRGSNTVSNLKLRASYGITGQQDIGSDYGYFGVYTRSQQTAQYLYYDPNNGGYQTIPITTIRPEGYDANLKWEETITYNVGLDYGFLNNRITGTLDVYLRETEDLLNEIPVPAGANLENVLVTNVGSLENRGLEFTFNALAVETADFSWNIGGNFTYNENEITKLTAVEDENYLGVQHEGISGGTGNLIKIHQVGQPAGSFFVYEQVYDENGMPIEGTYVDRNQDGVVDEGDLYVAGNAIPRFIIGLNTSINYRDWTFSASGRANLDRKVYNNVASNGAFFNKLQTNGQYLSNITTDINNTGFYEPQYFSDYYVQNGSFFRLDNVTLGYSFGEVLGTGSRLNVSATVNNVFVISPYEGIDPEIFNGVDNNFFPRPRTYVLGVNLSF